MKEYVYIGKIVNTHALKGEVRILSDFEYKDKVFKVGNILLIGNEKNEEIIESYRKHKNFDMVKFKGIENINDVLKYKHLKVYVYKNNLNLSDNELLYEDLIEMSVIYKNKEIGKIEDYINTSGNKVIKVGNKYLPYNSNFIENIDKVNKKIYYKNIEGLI